MSAYLCIEKNGMSIISFCRSSTVYEYLHDYVNWDGMKPIDTCDITCAIARAEVGISSHQDSIKIYRNAAQYLTSAEDIYEAMHSIHESEEYIEELREAIVIMSLLREMVDCDYDNNKNWTWGIM